VFLPSIRFSDLGVFDESIGKGSEVFQSILLAALICTVLYGSNKHDNCLMIWDLLYLLLCRGQHHELVVFFGHCKICLQ